MNPIPGAANESMTTGLDASYVNQAAPPGSLRYFALLYAPSDKRDTLAALQVIDKEIRDSANNASHDVAHTRLQWWRGEVDRLVNGVPQHPATRALHASTSTLTPPRLDFSVLHELLVAADMDLSRMTYANAAELRAYTRRSGGIPFELAAQALLAPGALSDPTRHAVSEIGSAIRRCELLRELPQEARHGRIYVPLEDLQARQLMPADLQSSSPARQALLAELEQATSQQLLAGIDAIPRADRASLRPLLVLAALHRRWLVRFSGRGHSPEDRVDLKPLERVWVAWRAARRAG